MGCRRRWSRGGGVLLRWHDPIGGVLLGAPREPPLWLEGSGSQGSLRGQAPQGGGRRRGARRGGWPGRLTMGSLCRSWTGRWWHRRLGGSSSWGITPSGAWATMATLRSLWSCFFLFYRYYSISFLALLEAQGYNEQVGFVCSYNLRERERARNTWGFPRHRKQMTTFVKNMYAPPYVSYGYG